MAMMDTIILLVGASLLMSLVVMIDMAERALRMKLDPETFYITDHYLNYPAMLVRLATVDIEDLRELLEESWRRSAPAALVAAGPGNHRPRPEPGEPPAQAGADRRSSTKRSARQKPKQRSKRTTK